MKKRMICLILTAALLLCAAPAAAADFTDISDPETAVAAATLQGLGIVSGRGDGTFDPKGTLTRAEACQLIVSAMGLSSQIAGYARKTLFSDVKPGEWYNGCVNLAYDKGIITGYGNGTFGPKDTVTYGQFATILLRMLGYSFRDVGSVWPRDYTAFAAELGLSDGIQCGDYDFISRQDAALMLCRAVKETPNGGNRVFYSTISGVASSQEAILLSVNAAYGGSTGLVMACTLGNSAAVEYYPQKITQSGVLIGALGVLLLDAAGKTVGFIPESEKTTDLVLSSAKASGITAADGSFTRITGTAKLIIGENVYTWNTNGYLQAASYAGCIARVYYDANGAAAYVRIAVGATQSATAAAVAETNSALSELKRKLSADSGCLITKNGSPAAAVDLSKYDVAYYDAAADTLRVSDYRVTGFIEGASPAVDGAETLTLAGHTFQVLESAWESLAKYSLGGKVTLLLTDDGKVAAAATLTESYTEMYGILGTDGKSVTLCGSGIKLTASTVSADAKLYGSLVRVSNTALNELSCSACSEKPGAGSLDLTAKTIGGTALSPACVIYENTGSGYVYSLSGVQGSASADFSEITWTTSIPNSSIAWYHLNSAGEVDVLLLKDVTGNCYSYGSLKVYTGSDGISSGSGLATTYDAVSVGNAESGTAQKYICTWAVSSGSYGGVALRAYDSRNLSAAAVVTLSSGGTTDSSGLFRDGDTWYAVIGDYEVPVSDAVQVYIAATGKWFSGETGILTVEASGAALRLYYDRSLTTGAQVRVIVAK